MHWRGNPDHSVNTGLMIVRKDSASRSFFKDLWNRRNTILDFWSWSCPTLGVCTQQQSLHEQQAFSDILIENPSLIGKIVSVVSPRSYSWQSKREHIALNTFAREGCYVRQQDGWTTDINNPTQFNDDPFGHWKVGDWMGQTAGVPTWGWWCGDYLDGKPPGPIRLDRINNMLKSVVRL